MLLGVWYDTGPMLHFHALDPAGVPARVSMCGMQFAEQAPLDACVARRRAERVRGAPVPWAFKATWGSCVRHVNWARVRRKKEKQHDVG